MQKTNLNKILFKIGTICFILAALLVSIHYFSFNESFYKKEHRKLQLYGKSIAEHIGISEQELDDLTSFTLDYLNDPETVLDKQMNIKGEIREVFTDDEKLHMVDVRTLCINSKYVMHACIVVFVLVIAYLIINKCSFNEFYRCSIKVGAFLLGIVAVLGIWIAIDFDSFWNFFHHIFFAGNDLWLLDLNKDILIMIVPPEFFFHLVTAIIFMFLIIVFFYYLILYIINRRIYD